MVTPTITQEQKEQWVKSLRSGKYKQSQSCLYHVADGGFCCLGVLADGVLGQNVKGPYIMSDQPKINKLYEEIRELVGDKLHAFTNMNDLKDYSFEDIADYIEQSI